MIASCYQDDQPPDLNRPIIGEQTFALGSFVPVRAACEEPCLVNRPDCESYGDMMIKKDMANRLIAALGDTLTMKDLKLDEVTHSCVLVFDKNVILNIEYDDPTGRLILSAYLDELPHQNAEPLLRELMAANLFWHRTHGATLCLEEGTGGVILLYAHSVIDLDRHSLETMVENLVRQAEHWQRHIVDFSRTAAHFSPASVATASALSFA